MGYHLYNPINIRDGLPTEAVVPIIIAASYWQFRKQRWMVFVFYHAKDSIN